MELYTGASNILLWCGCSLQNFFPNNCAIKIPNKKIKIWEPGKTREAVSFERKQELFDILYLLNIIYPLGTFF